MHFNVKRDLTSAGLGLVFGGPAGLAGTAAKKFFIDKNDGIGKRFLVGLATTVCTFGIGTIPYLIATPGKDAQADMMQSRASVAQNRYNQTWQ